MIIVEGPDGGGKTTLIKQILNQYPSLKRAPRASEGVAGPVSDLFDWTSRDVNSWDIRPLSVYDRHPVISEYIYGPIIRESLDERFHTSGLRRRVSRTALVIVCLPPLEVVRASVSDERDMPGVATHIDAIWHLYASLRACWPGWSGLLFHDYTRAGGDLSQIFAYINHHREHWSYSVD